MRIEFFLQTNSTSASQHTVHMGLRSGQVHLANAFQFGCIVKMQIVSYRLSVFAIALHILQAKLKFKTQASTWGLTHTHTHTHTDII